MDRRVIKNELRKITSYFKQKQINKDQIQEILNIQNDPNFNEIKDRALMGEKNKVNQLLSRTDILYDEVFLYLNTLNNRITRLHEINKMADGKKNYDEIIEKLKPPVFWKDKPMMVNQLKKWGQKQLEELLIKIGETEILMKKNSHLRNDVIIKNLIVNLTNKNITSF
jgi:DNA polymerase-3 subunit delta